MNGKSISRRDTTLIAIGLGILCVGAVADSSLNGFEESDAEALDTAVANLQKIPAQIGNWTSIDETLSDREREAAGIIGYVRRTYTNQKTGYVVHLTVLCGASGPISVHPPTACFEGIGYTTISGPLQTTVTPEGGHESCQFNRSTFRQSDASVPEIVRVYWGWSTSGDWTAPENPRFAYRGQSHLYKIYLTDQHLEDTRRKPLPQIEAFINEALPSITHALQRPNDELPAALAD